MCELFPGSYPRCARPRRIQPSVQQGETPVISLPLTAGPGWAHTALVHVYQTATGAQLMCTLSICSQEPCCNFCLLADTSSNTKTHFGEV